MKPNEFHFQDSLHTLGKLAALASNCSTFDGIDRQLDLVIEEAKRAKNILNRLRPENVECSLTNTKQ